MKAYIVNENDSQEKKVQNSSDDPELERIAYLYNKYRKLMELEGRVMISYQWLIMPEIVSRLYK